MEQEVERCRQEIAAIENPELFARAIQISTGCFSRFRIGLRNFGFSRVGKSLCERNYRGDWNISNAFTRRRYEPKQGSLGQEG